MRELIVGGYRLRLVSPILASLLLLACSRLGGPPPDERAAIAPTPAAATTAPAPPGAAPAVPTIAPSPVAVAAPAVSQSPAAAITTVAAGQPQPRTTGLPRFEADDSCSTGNDLCGFVVVPERHTNPAGRTIRLSIQVGRRANRDAPPDPVIYLQGGPGTKANTLSRMAAGSARINHDVISYEQRGVGKSQPNLDCPERDQQRLDDAVTSADDAARTANSRVSAAACRDRLTAQGIDLAAYNTAESAADLEDIRVALGYDRLNLVGMSYGTYLAQAAMRAYPSSIRSVVLDSVVPLELSAIPIIPSSNSDHAMERTFELCAANPACARTYPDLPETYKRAVARLTQQPGEVMLGASYGGSARVGSARFAQILFRELYSGPAQIPRMIAAVEQGKMQPLADRTMQLIFFNRGYSEGMNLSVICHTVGSTQADEFAVTGNGPITGLPWLRLSWPEFCQSWPHEPLDPSFRAAVTSGIPTLIIAGELDPVTPPASGQRVAQGLPNSIYVEMPAQGHVPGVQTVCGRAIVADFLDQKVHPLNTDCMNGPPVGFSLP